MKHLTERHGDTVVYTGSDQHDRLPANLCKVEDVERILRRLNKLEESWDELAKNNKRMDGIIKSQAETIDMLKWDLGRMCETRVQNDS